MRSKYKRLTDLYTQGVEVELRDGIVLWLQTLNPYERDEAVHDAQVVRSRIVLAMRESGSERLKLEASFEERGRDRIIKDLATNKASERLGYIAEEIREDKDWKERLEILERTDTNESAAPLGPEEQALLEQINLDYINELVKREDAEREWQTARLERLSDEDVLAELMEVWLEHRGSEAAQSEYALTELWYATRACEAVKVDGGAWDHSACNGHRERVFDSKADVRDLPGDLQTDLQTALTSLAMSARDAKNSDRQGSSFDSSPLPSEPAESTPSIPTEIPATPPGI